MNRELARKVADAVLYEGYMLYPYRPSAVKNRQRWTFGILYPPAYAEVQRGTERNIMHTECLLETSGDATIQVQFRFLHLLARQVSKAPLEMRAKSGPFAPHHLEAVPSLLIDGRLIESWDEGVERSVEFAFSTLGDMQRLDFRFPGNAETEMLRDHSGQFHGSVTRTQHELTGHVSISSEKVSDTLMKIVIDVVNSSQMEKSSDDRNSAILSSLLSAHTILAIDGGSFVSLLEPAEAQQALVAECRNVGNFPVLAGLAPDRDVLLCSPIVLYDYPQIAPESASNFFDATEMDEMLTLRVMTLTDQEKNEMAHADDRVRELLRRTEETAREQLTKTHGTIRSMRRVGEE